MFLYYVLLAKTRELCT